MRKILILEDEEEIREFIVINIKRAGFEVLEAATGEEALELLTAQNDIDIAILDVMLPGIDGFQVCKKIRENNKTIGIIMLTAKTQEMDKVNGLVFGADDYMSKPFSPSELVARIDALARRLELVQTQKTDELVSGVFKLDLLSRILHKCDTVIELTQVEFSTLKLFLENKNRAFSRDEILDEIWGKGYFGNWKIVDVNIRRLRKKIEDDPSKPVYIETIWGYGYRWGKVD